MKLNFESNLASEITSNKVLDESLDHVYNARKKSNENSDIWELRNNWKKYKVHIREQILSGDYLLTPVSTYTNNKGEYFSRWSSKDTVVLKAISLVLADKIETRDVYHVKNTGGLKGAVRRVGSKVKDYRYIIKSDVANFYGSMNHEIVLKKCAEEIKDKRILRIISQYLNYLDICNGHYRLNTRGISRGCPLSPIMGTIMLKSLDKVMNKSYCYTRYMDDWVILSNSKTHIRRAVKAMYRIMRQLKFKLALDKTYIGKVSKGFEFLGYRFSGHGIIGMARRTIGNFLTRTAELYEQGANLERIRCYIRKWHSWSTAGLNFK